MTHIIAATDFSEVADNAVHYACSLASDQGASVTVLHAFMIPVAFNDTPMPVMPLDEGREIADERMCQLQQELAQAYPGLNIAASIMYGDIMDCLEELGDERKPWLVVLGNSGSGESSLWLGSSVLSALRNLEYTVLAVPHGTTYKKPEKICFACDFKHINEHLPAGDLTSLMSHTGAQLHVLNVDHNNKEFTPETSLESTALHEALGALNPVYHYVEHEHVDEGIQEFMNANHMDWLVIMPHRYGFLEGIFHKSRTKAIIKMSNTPIVGLHER